ncbi:hypothetical protein [Terracoccus sp. 273MFTsu3.1]|uniref:hypothetical protein n=1 Tax=Terracoccus sp. 273MFTsu3.1 TaxID=1172188 RepID=UPI0018CA7B66|nr:hypothetical protein [Terracoccus sp. 273MFTsu3.1]
MREQREAHSAEAVRRGPTHRTTGVAPRSSVDDAAPQAASGFPVFAVREWASRFYEQERLERDAAWGRLSWPFVVALVLAAGAAAVAWRRPVGESDLGLGLVVVLAAAAVGVTIGGLLRVRSIRARRAVAAARPATVESLPESARAVVLDSPRLRFRRPADGPGFAALRDDVAAAAPVGEFAASVLVWSLVMRGHVDGTLEDWVRGRHT